MKQLRSLKIIALAMMAAGAIYVVALFVALQDPTGNPGDELWLPMVAVAAAVGVASFVVPRLLPRTGEGDTALKRALTGYFTRTIVSLAMAEAVILFGFAASFVAQEPLGIVPFFLTGELLLLLHFPRTSRFEAELEGQAQIEWLRQHR